MERATDGNTPSVTRDEWQQMADGMIGVVAHGLLNSVAVIKGASRTLLEGPGIDERGRAWLEIIDQQANLMAGVLKDLVRGLPADAMAELVQLGSEPGRR